MSQCIQQPSSSKLSARNLGIGDVNPNGKISRYLVEGGQMPTKVVWQKKFVVSPLFRKGLQVSVSPVHPVKIDTYSPDQLTASEIADVNAGWKEIEEGKAKRFTSLEAFLAELKR